MALLQGRTALVDNKLRSRIESCLNKSNEPMTASDIADRIGVNIDYVIMGITVCIDDEDSPVCFKICSCSERRRSVALIYISDSGSD